MISLACKISSTKRTFHREINAVACSHSLGIHSHVSFQANVCLLKRCVFPSATILAFMSSCDIIVSPRMPSFSLPGLTGNELAQKIAFIGGNVGGQGHTCVHYTGACVSVL